MALNILEALRVTTAKIKEYVDGKSAVSYGESQTLTDAEKEQARSNIGAPAIEHTHESADVTDLQSTIDSAVSAHNTATDAHSDIREALNNISVEVDTTLTEAGKAADAKAVGDAINAIPVSTTDDGYTEITGLRQAISANIVKSGNAITVTTSLEGDETTTSEITLDSDGYPTKIVTDGVECVISWDGFDVSTATIDTTLDEIIGEEI